MAPAKATDKTIAKELAGVVREVYNGPERDQLTVNYARKAVEEKLELAEGFLKEGDWKAKSKQIIVDTLNELESAGSEPSQPATPILKKSQAARRKGPGNNKRVKIQVPSDAGSESEDISDSDGASTPPTKKRKTAKVSKGKSKVVSDDEDGSASGGEEDSPERPARSRSIVTDTSSELSDAADDASDAKKENASKPPPSDESELSDVVDEPPKRKQKPKTKRSPPPTAPDKTATAGDDSSSELSSVIDEPPPLKRKRGKSGKDAVAPSKPPGGARGSAAAAADSPDEAQVKLLQSQLAKCGVRKVWAFEFKKHGADTAKAKIRHLKGMLAEVGMTGRFSEARAREIKEMRELQADLQDVMQGEQSWGVGGGGRGSRRRAAVAAVAKGKQFRDESSGEGEEESGEEKSGDTEQEESEEEGGGKPVVRRAGPAKRRADLAFLGSESESD